MPGVLFAAGAGQLTAGRGGNFQVTDNLVAQNLGGHKIERRRIARNDEADNFIYCAVFQLDALIIDINAHGVALALGVGVFEHQRYRADRFGPAPRRSSKGMALRTVFDKSPFTSSRV